MYPQVFKGLKNVLKIVLNLLSCLAWTVTLVITDNRDCQNLALYMLEGGQRFVYWLSLVTEKHNLINNVVNVQSTES